MKINIFGYTMLITRNKKPTYPVKTHTSIDFENYVNEYNCSYYTTPVNFDKVVLFNGEIVDFKEGIKKYNKIITSIVLNDQVIDRFKSKQNKYHKSDL